MTELAEWGNFYVIIGSATGTLIGLQFVVLTLMSQRPVPIPSDAGGTFATPTIVFFSTILFLAALLHAPWRSITPVAVIWGLMGVIGVLYVVIVARRMHSLTIYKPVFEDWFFYVLLPLVGYLVLAISAAAAFSYLREALFAAGAATLLFLFLGIHNSWDTVTYHIFTQKGAKEED